MTGRRRAAAFVAAACWLALFAGITLILLWPHRGWIGVTVIMAAVVIGSAVLALLRRERHPEDEGGAPGAACRHDQPGGRP